MERQVRKDPPQLLYWIEVDLSKAKVKLDVAPGGDDPDGAGPWQAILARPSDVAKRERFDITINGDFFIIDKDPESPARKNRWVRVMGPAASAGKAWAKAETKRPALVIGKDGKLSIAPHDQAPEGAWGVIAGNQMLVEKGKALEFKNAAVHPRTVIGLDEKATRLVILVVDGRKPGTATGMSYAQLAAEMLQRGCFTAVNLDGGGSSALVVRDPGSDQQKVQNLPSDGTERAVGNVLGLRFAP